MKAVVLVSRGSAKGFRPQLTEMEVPRPARGELVVEMKVCGMCGTDLEKMKGEYTASMPVVGHEAVGVVHAVGAAVAGFRAGDRVFPHHHVPCYECYFCRAGNETMCDKYRSSNIVPGGFSELFRVPSWNVTKGGVLKIPERIDFEVASLIEPLACCIRAVRRLGVRPIDSVLVAGAGPVGMMNALLLGTLCAKVVVTDVSETRLNFAERSEVGVVLNAAKEEVSRRVKSETKGRGADLAIVASGSKAAILQALNSVRRGGRVCLFGAPSTGSVLDYDISELFNSERQIITSYAATEGDTREALKVLSSRGPEFGRLITHRFPLESFDRAVEAASDGKAMKVVVTS